MIVYHVLGDGLIMSFAHFRVDRIRPYSRRTCKYCHYAFKMGNADKFSQARLRVCRYYQMMKLHTQLYTDTLLALIKQGLDPWSSSLEEIITLTRTHICKDEVCLQGMDE